MPRKMPKIPCKQPTPRAITTLREWEKAHQFQSFQKSEVVSRCVLWASDPKVLKKFFLKNGKFTLDKLLNPATYDKSKVFTTQICDMFLPSLTKIVKMQNPIMFSEIIDEHTILLLISPGLPLGLFAGVLQESPEHDVICAPVPLDIIWTNSAQRYTNRFGDTKKDTHESYHCTSHFSFNDASVEINGNYQGVKRLYDLLMQY